MPLIPDIIYTPRTTLPLWCRVSKANKVCISRFLYRSHFLVFAMPHISVVLHHSLFPEHPLGRSLFQTLAPTRNTTLRKPTVSFIPSYMPLCSPTGLAWLLCRSANEMNVCRILKKTEIFGCFLLQTSSPKQHCRDGVE